MTYGCVLAVKIQRSGKILGYTEYIIRSQLHTALNLHAAPASICRGAESCLFSVQLGMLVCRTNVEHERTLAVSRHTYNTHTHTCHMSIYLSVYLSMCLSVYLSIYLLYGLGPVGFRVPLSIYLPKYLSIDLSMCLSKVLTASYRSIF